MALLCNGPGTINPAELDNLDGDLGPNNDNDRSALSQAFTVGVGDLPLMLEFDWAFLTSEAPSPGNFDDFFMVRLNSADILNGSAPTGGVSPFPDVTPLDDVEYTVNSAGSANGCFFNDGQSGWRHFRYVIAAPGAYTLSILVSEQGNNDHAIDTGLLVDNFKLSTAAELSIAGSASPQPVVIAGEELLYTLNVTNWSPDIASDVVVTDTLPAGLLFLGSTGSCSEVSTNNLSCPLGDIPGGQSRTIVIKTLVPPDLAAGQTDGTLSIANLAGVSGSSPELTPADNIASLGSLVQDQADLRVTAMSEPETSVRAGEIFTYTVFVDNLGPSYARNVSLRTEFMMEHLDDLEILHIDPGSGRSTSTLQVEAIGSPDGPLLMTEALLLDPLETINYPYEIEYPGIIFPGRWRVQYFVRSNIDQVVHAVSHVYTASDEYAPGTPDPNLANNQAVETMSVLDTADLSLAKQAAGEVQVMGQAGGVFNITTPGATFPQGPAYTTSTTQVTAGRRARYTLTATNNGPTTAQNVVISDRLPANVVLYPGSLLVSQGSCETGTPGSALDRMECGLGTLAAGETETVTFQVLVGSGVPAGMVLENDALVASDTFDPDNSNNRVATLTTVNTWADMSISKSAVGEVVTGCDPTLGENATADLPDEVTAGKALRYELTVQNNGASDAQNVQVMDVLPDLFGGGQRYAVTFDRAVGAICRPDDEHALWSVIWPGASATGQAIICDLGTLAAGGRKTFDVYVRVNPSVPQGTVIDNGALVLFGLSSPPTQPPALFPGFPTIPPTLPVTNDPYTDNNFTVKNTTVHAAADLVIEKTSAPLKVFAGEQILYTLKVTNRGPATAMRVQAVDTLPADVSYEIDTLGAACSLTDTEPDVLTCSLGNLAPGEVVTWNISARVHAGIVIAPASSGTTILNQASVTSATADVCLASNSAAAENLVLGLADLRITKFGKPDDVVRAGSPLTYTIVVDNFGPSYAHEVAILDQIVSSGGFTLLSLTSDRDATCDPPGPLAALAITCVLDDPLEPTGVGNNGRWMVTVVVVAPEPGSINNLARVHSADLDPDLGNNEATVQHDISAVVDLSVTKTAVGEIMLDGELLHWGASEWPWGLTQLWPDLPIGSWVNGGRVLTYTLTITNNGPSTAQNIVVKDYLPEGVAPPDLPLTSTLPLNFVVRRVNLLPPSQGSCLWGVLGDPATPLECNLDSLAGGAAAQIQVVVSIPKTTPVGTTYYNRVRVYNDLFDPLNGNNMDDLFTALVPPVWLHYLPSILADYLAP